MAKSFKSLLKKLPPWFQNHGEEGDVIIGSMARVVRNLVGHKFPGWSTDEDRKAVADKLLPLIKQLPGNKTAAFCAEMPELDYTQRRVLLERKLMTQCMAARQGGCHVVINGKQDVTYMVNEEEHLVMHLFSSESDYESLIGKAEAICTKLAGELTFAQDATGDYLTSLPTEAGSGVQLYTVMHLPALVAADMMPQIKRALEKLMLHIAPLYSNMGDDVANLFVVYTPPILKNGEDDMVGHLRDITLTIAECEHDVRNRLCNNTSTITLLPDMVSRAYGLLQYAYRLEYSEFINALSMMRLGVVLGYIEPLETSPAEFLAYLASLSVICAPYHMEYQVPENGTAAHEMGRTSFSRNIQNNAMLTIELMRDILHNYSEND